MLYLLSISKFPAASLGRRLTPRKDVDAPALLQREIIPQKRIHKYVETVNSLLKYFCHYRCIFQGDIQDQVFLEITLPDGSTVFQSVQGQSRSMWRHIIRATIQEYICGGITSEFLRQHTHVLSSKTQDGSSPTGSVCSTLMLLSGRIP